VLATALTTGKTIDFKGKNNHAQKLCRRRFSTLLCSLMGLLNVSRHSSSEVIPLFTISVEKGVNNNLVLCLSC
jgi:hypothetical protein